MTCWTVVGYFLTMMSIHKWVLFILGEARFQGILFVEWDIYYMFLCSHYWEMIPIGVHIGGKVTVTLNILYFMKG